MIRSLIFILAFGLLTHNAQAEVALAPHRITYDLKLKEASDKKGISAATGRMVFEFLGSACEGFTSTARIVLNMKGQNGESIVNDQRTTSFETADENNFRFVTTAFINGQPKDSISGEAKRAGEGIALKLTKPAPHTANFARDVKFPNGFLKAIIEGAAKGEKFVAQDVYDGGDGGKILYNTSATIQNAQSQDGSDIVKAALEKKDAKALKKWRVQVGYFDSAKAGDPLPDYSFSAILYENGVTDQIIIDYGDIAFIGTTKSFEVLPVGVCK